MALLALPRTNLIPFRVSNGDPELAVRTIDPRGAVDINNYFGWESGGASNRTVNESQRQGGRSWNQ